MNVFVNNEYNCYPGLNVARAVLVVLISGLFIVSCSSINTIMEPNGDLAAKPMIEKIEKFKEDNGNYPESLMKLIPKYLARYDFQAYLYQYNFARGEKLELYVQKGLIAKGQGDGYVLTVRFDQYTGECTYVNGTRKSCRYIGGY